MFIADEVAIGTEKAKKMRVGVMGAPASSGNQGIVALRAALVHLCLNAAPQVDVSLFGSKRDKNPIYVRVPEGRVEVPIIHWRLSPACSPRDHIILILAMSLVYRCFSSAGLRRWIAGKIPWIKALEETSFVGDVRGGDSFSDIYGLWRFLIATLPVLSVIAVKGTIVHFPQTYGPFKGAVARSVAGWVLRQSSVIFARDLASQRIAQQLVGGQKEVFLSPDVAFALYTDPMCRVRAEPGLDGPLPAGLIGINVNGLMFNGGYRGGNMFNLRLEYRTFLVGLVEALLHMSRRDLLLVPHTFAPAGDPESDNDACRQLVEMLPNQLRARIRIVTGEYDAHELKGIVGQCEFFVGSRMHSCIAALSQGVPCVGVAYSMKFAGVFESVGAGDWVVDGRSSSNEMAIESVVECYGRREVKRKELQDRAAEAKSALQDIFRDLLKAGRGRFDEPARS